MAHSLLAALRPVLPAIVLTTGLLSAVNAEPASQPSAQFVQAPRLVRTETDTPAATRISGTTYRFTLTVPANAGAALQAVTLTQTGNFHPIAFEVNQSRATVNGRSVPLASVGGTAGEDTTIAFAQPIQPGETVTIALKADRNPETAGIYSFGLTAYPVGNPQGLALGYGRVTVYGYGR